MDFITYGLTWIMNNLQYVVLSMTIMILVSFITFIIMNVQLSNLNRKYKKMMSGMNGANIEQMLINHIEEVRTVSKKATELTENCQRLDAISKTCVQKVGMIRFNAFEEMGSDQSFAVALLDAQNNGVVLSSICGRTESRTYAKPIQGGQSTYFLTEEEKKALQQAIEKK